MSLKIMFWLPRILGMAAILFVSLFAFDAFDPGLPFGKQLLAFAIHLVPSFILLALLLLAWKWERLGGILFIILGLALTPWLYSHNYAMNNNVGMSIGIVLMIAFPFVLVGVLFLLAKSKNINS